MPQAPNSDETISTLVEAVPCVSPEAHGAEVNDFFERHHFAEGVVVVDNERPLGLIMRNDFFQKLGAPFGREVFLRRPVHLIMNARPLIVDISVQLGEISMLAMSREQDGLYDMVVVTDNDRYAGAVSIKHFLIELSQKRAQEIELLKRQHELLELANKAEMESRRLIEKTNASIRNLLDNAGQGFLSFGSDMTVSEEHSLECIHFFRGPVAGKNFVELLGKFLCDDARDTMRQALSKIFTVKTPLQRKVYLSLLPGKMEIYNRTLTLECKLIQDEGDVLIMAVLTDVTEKEELQRRMADERANLRMIVKAVSERSDLLAALDELRNFFPVGAKEIINNSDDPAEALTTIFRVVHTFKGDFGQRQMTTASLRLHEIEEALSRLGHTPQAVTPEALCDIVEEADAQEVIGKDVGVMSKALGPAFFEQSHTFEIPRQTLRQLEIMITRRLSPEDAAAPLALLRSVSLHNFKVMLEGCRDTLRALAAKLGKSIADLEVLGDDVLVEKGVYQPFVKSLVHVFRNIADHGIEPLEKRLSAGKPELGRVSCQITAEDTERFRLVIRDDGGGIDFDKVRAKAATIMAPDKAARLSQEQLRELLFLDNFSTKDSVSLVSGRGVGLAAVRGEIQKLGGSIQIVSHRGIGTEFHFDLPLLEKKNSLQPQQAEQEWPASSALQ
ncbi:MAG: ATP-binding protein [Solidesulfovibrio sp.]